MKLKPKMINIIFDYDGTLHESIKIYAPAFRLAYEYLVSLGKAENKVLTDEEISKWLGYSSKDMWNAFMPHLSEKLKAECSQMIGNKMLRLVKEGKAQLYPHTLEVLRELKDKGNRLIFLSNCKHSYMQAHIKQFQLDTYFSAFYCTEDFNFKPKYEIFSVIKQTHSGEFIVIGDRFQDMDIAKKHGLKAIGCDYGYGNAWEIETANVILSKIENLIESIENI